LLQQSHDFGKERCNKSGRIQWLVRETDSPIIEAINAEDFTYLYRVIVNSLAYAHPYQTDTIMAQIRDKTGGPPINIEKMKEIAEAKVRGIGGRATVQTLHGKVNLNRFITEQLDQLNLGGSPDPGELPYYYWETWDYLWQLADEDPSLREALSAIHVSLTEELDFAQTIIYPLISSSQKQADADVKTILKQQLHQWSLTLQDRTAPTGWTVLKRGTQRVMDKEQSPEEREAPNLKPHRYHRWRQEEDVCINEFGRIGLFGDPTLLRNLVGAESDNINISKTTFKQKVFILEQIAKRLDGLIQQGLIMDDMAQVALYRYHQMWRAQQIALQTGIARKDVLRLLNEIRQIIRTDLKTHGSTE